jgi:peptidoglycan hydrolase-like protein with peptidoglycan-binding domain
VYPEGIITGWFGQLTKKAVEKFQNKYGLDPVGIVGPQTRAKLAEVFGSSSIAQSSAPSSGTTAPSSSVSAVFTIGLKKGMSNGDIKRLQQLLNSDPDTKIADSGIGSPGNETEYFGSLTEIAIKKLQSKYGLASEGDAGYGYVGPKTRAKLQKIFSQ